MFLQGYLYRSEPQDIKEFESRIRGENRCIVPAAVCDVKQEFSYPPICYSITRLSKINTQIDKYNCLRTSVLLDNIQINNKEAVNFQKPC